MLDDGHCHFLATGRRELVHQPPGGVGVEDVQIGELPAAVLDHVVPPRALTHDPVASPVLVGVLAVSHRPGPLQAQVDHGWQSQGQVELLGPGLDGPGPLPFVEPGHDGGVVPRGMGERLARQPASRVGRQRALAAELVEDGPVLGRVDHDADVVVVLGRRPHHGGPSDVDELDRGIGGEGIEVADHQVDEADAQLLDVREMVGLRPVGQDAPVDGGVEGLDPAPEHLGRTGEIGHLDVVDARLGQRGRGAPARHQLPAELREPAGQPHETGLVVHGQQCPHGATSVVDPGPSPAVVASPAMKRRMVSG